MKSQIRIQKSIPGRRASQVVVMETKTYLSPIRGRQVLVLFDEQNLSIGAKELGFRLQYDLLARQLQAIAENASLHIFAAADSYDRGIRKRFEKLGYTPHIKTIRRKHQYDGRKRLDSNIDNLFAFWAGLLGPKTTCEVIVLASGDYGLSGELAKAVRTQHDKAISVMTLSLPGSTAFDLDARKNPHITANLEIGLDVLTPLVKSRSRFPVGVNQNLGRLGYRS